MIDKNQNLFNVVPLSLENGLNNKPILRNMNYIMLYQASIGANVTVKYNSTEGDSLTMPIGQAIKSNGAEQVYVSADAVTDGKIVIIQAKNIEDFEIFPPVVVNDIDEINTVNSFSQALLDKLDKIANPYQDAVHNVYKSNSQSWTTLVNKTLDCDKLIIDGIATSAYANNLNYWKGKITVQIDDTTVYHQFTKQEGTQDGVQKTFYNVRGKNIQIQGIGDGGYFQAILQEFSKKV